MKMALRLVDLKNKLHVQHTFYCSQQKANLHVQHAFSSFPCRCFAPLQRCFVRLKRQTSQLHIIFMEELSYVFTQYFVSCFHVRFHLSPPLIFTLLAASISHFLTAALNFHVFLPTKFVSFVFNNSLQLFLSYPRQCKHKNNAEKDTTLLLFFHSKIPGGHVKTLSCIWVAILD